MTTPNLEVVSGGKTPGERGLANRGQRRHQGLVRGDRRVEGGSLSWGGRRGGVRAMS